MSPRKPDIRRRSGRMGIYGLTAPAEADRLAWPERVWLLDGGISLRTVMHDSYGCVNQTILYCFCSRRELADCKV